MSRVIREGLAEKIAFAQRPEVGKGARMHGKHMLQAEQHVATRILGINARAGGEHACNTGIMPKRSGFQQRSRVIGDKVKEVTGNSSCGKDL